MTKLKAFEYEKFTVAKMIISASDKEETIVGKHFFPFLTMFSKCFLNKVIKSRKCAVKVCGKITKLPTLLNLPIFPGHNEVEHEEGFVACKAFLVCYFACYFF